MATKSGATKGGASKATGSKSTAKKAPATKSSASKTAAKSSAAKSTAKTTARSGAASKSTATRSTAAKSTAGKTTAAKKTATGGTKRKVNPALMKPLTPSPQLAAVVGGSPLPRPEVVSKVWDYIKKNKLQNPENKREIVADDKLQAVFGKKKVTMFEMNKHLANHLK